MDEIPDKVEYENSAGASSGPTYDMPRSKDEPSTSSDAYDTPQYNTALGAAGPHHKPLTRTGVSNMAYEYMSTAGAAYEVPKTTGGLNNQKAEDRENASNEGVYEEMKLEKDKLKGWDFITTSVK